MLDLWDELITCETAGLGIFTRCAWFDAAFYAGFYLSLYWTAEVFWSGNSSYQKLNRSNRESWTKEPVVFIHSLVCLVGGVLALSSHGWWLEHPEDKRVLDYPEQMRVLGPAFLGWELFTVALLLRGYVVVNDPDIKQFSFVPSIVRIVAYVTVLRFKVFGMFPVFIALAQSPGMIIVAVRVLYAFGHGEGAAFRALRTLHDWTMVVVATFSGPYSFWVLWIHWDDFPIRGGPFACLVVTSAFESFVAFARYAWIVMKVLKLMPPDKMKKYEEDRMVRMKLD